MGDTPTWKNTEPFSQYLLAAAHRDLEVKYWNAYLISWGYPLLLRVVQKI